MFRLPWEVYDERLQFMSHQHAMRLDESLDAGDVSRAWIVWSFVAVADAFRFRGGPVPTICQASWTRLRYDSELFESW